MEVGIGLLDVEGLWIFLVLRVVFFFDSWSLDGIKFGWFFVVFWLVVGEGIFVVY